MTTSVDRLAQLATHQAISLTFTRLGRFEGNVHGLLDEIDNAFALEPQKGSRGVDAALHELFETGDAPVVRQLFIEVRLEDLPATFRALESTLLAQLNEMLTPQACGELLSTLAQATPEPIPMFTSTIQDWRIREGSEELVPVDMRQEFALTIVRGSMDQLYVDIEPKSPVNPDLEGERVLGLCVEIQDGRPCVHISNSIEGDSVLAVFATPDGLYLRQGYREHFFQDGRGANSGDIGALHDTQLGARKVVDNDEVRVLRAPNFEECH